MFVCRVEGRTRRNSPQEGLPRCDYQPMTGDPWNLILEQTFTPGTSTAWYFYFGATPSRPDPLVTNVSCVCPLRLVRRWFRLRPRCAGVGPCGPRSPWTFPTLPGRDSRRSPSCRDGYGPKPCRPEILIL